MLLRTSAIKYHPTTRCRRTTRSAAGPEQHDLTRFYRDEFRAAPGRAGMRFLRENYTDQVLRVEGLGERLFFLNHLYAGAPIGRWLSRPARVLHSNRLYSPGESRLDRRTA